MGKRRRAREAAVQYHFWRDLQRGEGPEKIDDFWEFCPATPRVRDFAQPLIEGNGRASSGNRRTNSALLRELRISPYLGGRPQCPPPGDLRDALPRRHTASGLD